MSEIADKSDAKVRTEQILHYHSPSIKTTRLPVKLCILPFKNKCVDPVKVNI